MESRRYIDTWPERQRDAIGAMTTAARAASAWALVFAAAHVFWALAYVWWPAAGRATLGPMFEQAFSRPWFMAYDLIAGALFGLAAANVLAVTDSKGRSLPRSLLVGGVCFAAVLLLLRGAAGVVLDALVLLNIVHGQATALMLYDVWFLLGGLLFAAAAWPAYRNLRAQRP